MVRSKLEDVSRLPDCRWNQYDLQEAFVNLSLEYRKKLPEALRVLLEEYPRDAWESHDNFTEMVTFWLSRHLMFRRLVETLQADAEAVLDKRADPGHFNKRVSQLGSTLLNELHSHHMVEDHHYFPQLNRLEPRLVRGFSILDADHHDLDNLLECYATNANGVIQGNVEVGYYRDHVVSFATFLDRHLVDEEELIVPVILKHGPPESL